MKYLVTGGMGFIGSNFIRFVLKKYPEAQVTNLDKLSYATNPATLDDLKNDSSYRFVKGDILDADLVNQLVPECDVIVHFAAETHVDRSILGPGEFLNTNVIGTQILLDAAVKNRKRFHHISTDEVFGSLPLDSTQKFDHASPYDPRSPYSASKAASDHLVRAYVHTYGLQATISNCSNNYGPYQYVEKLIPLMVINALHDKPLPVYGDGLNVRDWVHVEDHNAAVDLIIMNGRIGETYLIGGNAEVPNIEVVKNILKILGKDETLIKYVKDRPGHDRRYAIDSTRTEQELGFTRKYDFKEGLKQTVEWYLNNEGWWKNLLSEEFKDYYRKQYREV